MNHIIAFGRAAAFERRPSFSALFLGRARKRVNSGKGLGANKMTRNSFPDIHPRPLVLKCKANSLTRHRLVTGSDHHFSEGGLTLAHGVQNTPPDRHSPGFRFQSHEPRSLDLKISPSNSSSSRTLGWISSRVTPSSKAPTLAPIGFGGILTGKRSQPSRPT